MFDKVLAAAPRIWRAYSKGVALIELGKTQGSNTYKKP